MRSKTLAARLRAAGCVFAEEEAGLLLSEATNDAQLESMVKRRVAGLPLEQILGWAEFCGLRIKVEPGVFVPRRRSELLVREAARMAGAGDVVVDLGCGSGALGAALHAKVPGICLYATDIEPAAVACARKNLLDIGEVFEGDLYENLPGKLRGHVNLIIVNAPYVPTDKLEFMPSEARLYEPAVTLDGGTDGHAVQRRAVAGAVDWLAADGTIIMETSAGQAAETVAIMEANGLTARPKRNPTRDATIVVGRNTASH